MKKKKTNVTVRRIKAELKYMRETRIFPYRHEYGHGYHDALDDVEEMINSLKTLDRYEGRVNGRKMGNSNRTKKKV